MNTLRCRCGKTRKSKRNGKHFTCPECLAKGRAERAARPVVVTPPQPTTEAFPSFKEWLDAERFFAAKQEMTWKEYTKGASRQEIKAIYESEKASKIAPGGGA